MRYYYREQVMGLGRGVGGGRFHYESSSAASIYV